jgi:hypothetical protein
VRSCIDRPPRTKATVIETEQPGFRSNERDLVKAVNLYITICKPYTACITSREASETCLTRFDALLGCGRVQQGQTVDSLLLSCANFSFGALGTATERFLMSDISCFLLNEWRSCRDSGTAAAPSGERSFFSLQSCVVCLKSLRLKLSSRECSIAFQDMSFYW